MMQLLMLNTGREVCLIAQPHLLCLALPLEGCCTWWGAVADSRGC
jgi:hypothetical protein